MWSQIDVGFTFPIRQIRLFQTLLLCDVVDVGTFRMEFFFFSGLFYFFCLGLGFQKRYRNWEKFVVDFYWFNWKSLYVKVDLNLYKTDVLLKLRTKIIKCAAIWFSDDEDLSEEGRSRSGKVSGIQEILKKRIGCLLGRETHWRSFQSFVLVVNRELS